MSWTKQPGRGPGLKNPGWAARWGVCLLVMLCAVSASGQGTRVETGHLPKPLPAQFRRIVFIGDSITDGDTYPLLIRQALVDAGCEAPTVICAGVASDVSAQMKARLDRDVLPYYPTLVTLHAGANDALRGVTPEQYRANVAAIVERLKAEKIPMILLTTSIYGPSHVETEAILKQFNAALHDVARQNGYPVAEVYRLMDEARAAGKNPVETDDVHPNYLGQSLIARAVLDAMGYKEAPVAADYSQFNPPLMPGIITPWYLRAAPVKSTPLSERTVLELKPDDTWTTYSLPEKEPLPVWWLDQERKRGFALSLDKVVGQSSSYQGIAYLEEKALRKVYFNTGAQVNTVWVNGRQIYKNTGWTGWHAGKERIPVELQAGRNEVVMETGPQFFLSITEDNQW